MKGLLIGITAVLVLAAGCASQRAEPGMDPAPSQAAAGGSGWSVPPGSTGPATGEQAAQPDSGQPENSAAVAGSTQGDHSARGDEYEREKPVKPIVPAFPQRSGEQRLTALERVFFAFDRWDITPEMAQVLDHNAQWLASHPRATVKVEGHTDERGTAEYNLSLGERRARSVRDYLVSKGVARERLNTLSYGEEVPLAVGSTEQAWSRNRRVEFSLTEAAARRMGQDSGRLPN